MGGAPSVESHRRQVGGRAFRSQRGTSGPWRGSDDPESSCGHSAGRREARVDRASLEQPDAGEGHADPLRQLPGRLPARLRPRRGNRDSAQAGPRPLWLAESIASHRVQPRSSRRRWRRPGDADHDHRRAGARRAQRRRWRRIAATAAQCRPAAPCRLISAAFARRRGIWRAVLRSRASRSGRRRS